MWSGLPSFASHSHSDTHSTATEERKACSGSEATQEALTEAGVRVLQHILRCIISSGFKNHDNLFHES
jgi:hypothetical protein